MRNNKIFRYNGQVPGYCLTFQVLLLKFDEIFEIHTATLYNHSCQQYLVWLIGDIGQSTMAWRGGTGGPLNVLIVRLEKICAGRLSTKCVMNCYERR